jgi:hypothetical protein
VKIPGIELEDLAQGLEGAVHVVQVAARGGEVEPRRDAGTVASDRLQQDCLRGREVAGAHRPPGRLIQARRIVGHAGSPAKL